MKDRTSSIKHRAYFAETVSPVRIWPDLKKRKASALFKRSLKLPLLLALFAVFICGFGNSHAQVSREYQIKAVFLYNFAQFTEWPNGAFADGKAPIVIGVIGADPFGHTLEDTVKGETIQGHPFVIEHYHRADEIKTCHILFISQSENRHMDEILRSVKAKPTLTVADADGPADAGVIIRFMVENNKVHFRINEQAANDAHLSLSSRLLRVGEATPSGRRQ